MHARDFGNRKAKYGNRRGTGLRPCSARARPLRHRVGRADEAAERHLPPLLARTRPPSGIFPPSSPGARNRAAPVRGPRPGAHDLNNPKGTGLGPYSVRARARRQRAGRADEAAERGPAGRTEVHRVPPVVPGSAAAARPPPRRVDPRRPCPPEGAARSAHYRADGRPAAPIRRSLRPRWRPVCGSLPGDRGNLGGVGGTNPCESGAGSQRIVAARPLCRLQCPVAYLSRLQRILPAARPELRSKAAARGRCAAGAAPAARALGGRGPLLRVGRRAAGSGAASLAWILT